MTNNPRTIPSATPFVVVGANRNLAGPGRDFETVLLSSHNAPIELLGAVRARNSGSKNGRQEGAPNLAAHDLVSDYSKSSEIYMVEAPAFPSPNASEQRMTHCVLAWQGAPRVGRDLDLINDVFRHNLPDLLFALDNGNYEEAEASISETLYHVTFSVARRSAQRRARRLVFYSYFALIGVAALVSLVILNLKA